MRYLPHTEQEIEAMLQTIGSTSLDQLFTPIPESVRFQGELAVPPALGEPELMGHLRKLSEQNTGAGFSSFLGAGSYDHHIPPAVDQLLLRGEFYTAYTPYQPEVAQGTLQAIWEFQTLVSELYGLPIANASMYDGASAAAEGTQMARRLTRRNRVVVCRSVHPDYRAVIRTYLGGTEDAEVIEVDVGSDGGADVEAIGAAVDARTAAVVVGYPSFLGTVTHLRPLADLCHERGALLISSTAEPYALALVEAPGDLGADIATGEGQPLACPPSFGGPGVGLFACRNERSYLQQLPGRICGETVDSKGQRGFVLTLSTREQHIRRERATSNICTNQGLLALAFAIRVSLLGKRGFIETSEACLAKAEYLKRELSTLAGCSLRFPQALTFNEFVVRLHEISAGELCRRLEGERILAGYDLGRVDPQNQDCLLIAVTEKHARSELDRLVQAIRTATA